MLAHYAPRAHVQLVVLAEVLGLLLGMLEAELLREVLFVVYGRFYLVFMLIEVVYL